MIVKIRDTYYSAREEPIMLMFDDSDIQNLMEMPEGNRILCIFPDHMDVQVVKDWMNEKGSEKQVIDKLTGKIMTPESKIVVPKLAPRKGFKP